MVDLVPKLANAKVRRTWRGLYPMTPDFSPIVGASEKPQGYIDARSGCAGRVSGPASLVSRLVTGKLAGANSEFLKELGSGREFGGVEALK